MEEESPKENADAIRALERELKSLERAQALARFEKNQAAAAAAAETTTATTAAATTTAATTTAKDSTTGVVR